MDDAFFTQAHELSSVGSLPSDEIDASEEHLVTPRDPEDFDGLLIGVFYASMTCDYPSGVVPMTRYGDELQDKRGVRALHLMSKPILDIDYSNFGVSGVDRKWKNIFSQGLRSLRYRITSLFIGRRILLSLADLVAMKDDQTDAVLTIRSNYGTRRLPVAGVFADTAPDDRADAISDFAKELLGEAEDKDAFEAIAEARTLAEQHWSRYVTGTEVVEQRWLLSELCAGKRYDAEFSPERHAELNKLLAAFEASGPRNSDENKWKNWEVGREEWTMSIEDLSDDGLIVRWASVFVLARLIAHVLSAQSRLGRQAGNPSLSAFAQFGARDWLLALMPSPKTPLVLPVHHKGKNNPAGSGGTLHRKLLKLKSDLHLGDCGLDCEHVFSGKGRRGNDRGLRPVERRLLESAVIDHLTLAGEWSGGLESFRAGLPSVVRLLFQGEAEGIGATTTT